MSEHEHLEAQWLVWRHSRLSMLTHPYGWTSIAVQHWLHEGQHHERLDGLPGTWSVQDGRVWYSPEAGTQPGEFLTLHGKRVTQTTEIPLGRILAHDSDPALIFFGGSEIEALQRVGSSGAPSFAVRVRDPRRALTPQTLSLQYFPYNIDFRVRASFTSHSPHEVVRETVAEGVIDIVKSIGTLRFTLGNSEHSLIVFAEERADSIIPFTHVSDTTSGSLTHPIGRRINLEFPDDNPSSIDTVDFNYLASLPCSVSPFVSCPLPIAENRLSVALPVGEQTPKVL